MGLVSLKSKNPDRTIYVGVDTVTGGWYGHMMNKKVQPQEDERISTFSRHRLIEVAISWGADIEDHETNEYLSKILSGLPPDM